MLKKKDKDDLINNREKHDHIVEQDDTENNVLSNPRASGGLTRENLRKLDKLALQQSIKKIDLRNHINLSESKNIGQKLGQHVRDYQQVGKSSHNLITRNIQKRLEFDLDPEYTNDDRNDDTNYFDVNENLKIKGRVTAN
jgi:hypothetical protein